MAVASRCRHSRVCSCAAAARRRCVQLCDERARSMRRHWGLQNAATCTGGGGVVAKGGERGGGMRARGMGGQNSVPYCYVMSCEF